MKNTEWTNYWNEINPKKENKRNLIRVGPDRLADPSSVLHWSLPPSSASQTLKVKGRSKKGGKRFRLTNLFWNLKYGQSLIFGIATILPHLPQAPRLNVGNFFNSETKLSTKHWKMDKILKILIVMLNFGPEPKIWMEQICGQLATIESSGVSNIGDI